MRIKKIFFFAGKTCIPVEDIISVHTPRNQSTSSPSSRGQQQIYPVLDATSPSLNGSDDFRSSNSEFNYKSITVNYAKRCIDPTDCGSEQGSCSSSINKWRIHTVTLFNNDCMIVKEWYDTLTKILNGENFF